MPKPFSETTHEAQGSTCSFEHFMMSSVIDKSTDNGKLFAIIKYK